MSKRKELTIWQKGNILILLCGFFLVLVNLVIWKNTDLNARKIDNVYGSNVSLNELQTQLEQVQTDLDEYLDLKTSVAMEEYYESSANYSDTISAIENTVTNSETALMEVNIKHLSETYLEYADATVEAKRARNIEEYKENYEEAVTLYGYIRTYIYSLNNQQFKDNSQTYTSLLSNFHVSEGVSLSIMLIMIALIMGLMYLVGARMTALEESREKLKLENAIREKEHEMESSIKDAKLKAMQAQIHPHFLFNTLNAGAQLAMLEDAPRSYDYMQNLAEFFRYNLKKSDQVTLGEEIDLVDHYLYIINVRFAGEIHYEKKIDPKLLSFPIPSMILQPLVENSVNYGVRNITREKRIELEVTAGDAMVYVAVRDNGSGISEDMIARILAGENARDDRQESNGVGMQNVISRLKLFYHSEDVIMIHNLGEHQGTEVVLCLPQAGEETDD